MPSGRTTSTARMWALVTPYSRQCGPPELLARLPPTEHDCWLDGSGAKCSPRWATARDRSRLSTPGCTQARRWTASTSRMRFILVVTITTGRHVAGRRGPTGQAGARSPGHERTAVIPAHPHGGRHFCGGGREAHHRGLTGDHGGVPPVQAELGRLRARPVGRRRPRRRGLRIERSRSVGHVRRRLPSTVTVWRSVAGAAGPAAPARTSRSTRYASTLGADARAARRRRCGRRRPG